MATTPTTCEHCGAAVAPTDHFCAGCGTEVEHSGRAPRRSMRWLLVGGSMITVLALAVALLATVASQGKGGCRVFSDGEAPGFLWSGGGSRPIFPGPVGEPDLVWSAPFDDLVDLGQADGVIALLDTDRLSGRSVATGKELWRYRFPKGESSGGLDAAEDRFVFAYTDTNDGRVVVSVDAETGDELWRHTYDAYGPEVMGDHVLVPSLDDEQRKVDGFEILRLADGERVWGDALFPFRAGDRIVTFDNGELVVRSLATGREVSHAEVSDGASLWSARDGLGLLSDDDSVWIAQLSNGQTCASLPDDVREARKTATIADGMLTAVVDDSVTVYDLAAGGEEAWSRDGYTGLGGTAFRVWGDYFVFLAPEDGDSEVVEMRTGHRRFRYDEEEASLVSDYYAFAQGEGELTAFDPDSGAEVWSVRHGGTNFDILRDGVVLLDFDSGQLKYLR